MLIFGNIGTPGGAGTPLGKTLLNFDANRILIQYFQAKGLSSSSKTAAQSATRFRIYGTIY